MPHREIWDIRWLAWPIIPGLSQRWPQFTSPFLEKTWHKKNHQLYNIPRTLWKKKVPFGLFPQHIHDVEKLKFVVFKFHLVLSQVLFRLRCRFHIAWRVDRSTGHKEGIPKKNTWDGSFKKQWRWFEVHGISTSGFFNFSRDQEVSIR